MLNSDGRKILNTAYQEYLEKQNNLRIERQQRQYSHYIGDESDILEYLEKALLKTFDKDDVKEFQLNWVNITKKIINQLAIVYSQPATRYFPEEEGKEDSYTKYYNSILPEDVNTRLKKAHRIAKLQNTSLTQVIFDNGKINYIVDSSHKFDVEVDENDPHKVNKVSYAKYLKNGLGEDELYIIVWTDTEHYKQNQNGDKFPIGDNKDMKNPYGTLNFAALSLEEGEDFWGEGADDVIKVNEQINVLLTMLVNEHILLGGAGTVLATNLNLSKNIVSETTGELVTVTDKVRIGRKHPISIDGVKTDDKDPDLRYISTNPLIVEIRGVIDWYIKMIALMKGLNPNSFLAEVQATSGYSKVVDSLEQLEIRKDDIEPCKLFEKRLFEITKAVNNAHAQTKEGAQYKLKVIPDNMELITDFAEISVPKTVDEQIKKDEFDLKYNLISTIDLMMRENPDLTKESAEKLLKENKRIRDTYIEKGKTLGQLFNNKMDGINGGQ